MARARDAEPGRPVAGIDQGAANRRIRVVIVIGSLSLGGAQRHVVDLARQIDRERFDVSFVVLTAGGRFYDLARELGFQVYDLRVRSRRHLVLRFPEFASYIRRLNPDVLHLFLYESSVFGCLVRLLRPGGPRVILSKRSLEIDLRPDRAFVYRRMLMKVPDAITAVSEAVKRRCHELGAAADKVRVIENGIEAREVQAEGRLRRRLGLPDHVPLVGAVGSLTIRKGHTHILRMLPRLLQRVPDAHVVLVGEGSLRPELEAESRRLRIADRVHLPGALFPVLPFLADLSVFVLPSSEEGMSNALLEAMMIGLPCVSSNIASNCEVVTAGEDGLLVDVADADAFAAAVATLVTNPPLRQSIAAAASATIRRRFTPNTMIEANAELYISLARQRRQSQAAS